MQKRAHPALLAAWIGLMVASWPFNLIFGKVALRYLPAPAVASFRLLLAAILMLPIYWFTHSRFADGARLNQRFDLRDIKTFVLLAVLGVVINQRWKEQASAAGNGDRSAPGRLDLIARQGGKEYEHSCIDRPIRAGTTYRC